MAAVKIQESEPVTQHPNIRESDKTESENPGWLVEHLHPEKMSLIYVNKFVVVVSWLFPDCVMVILMASWFSGYFLASSWLCPRCFMVTFGSRSDIYVWCLAILLFVPFLPNTHSHRSAPSARAVCTAVWLALIPSLAPPASGRPGAWPLSLPQHWIVFRIVLCNDPHTMASVQHPAPTPCTSHTHTLPWCLRLSLYPLC